MRVRGGGTQFGRLERKPGSLYSLGLRLSNQQDIFNDITYPGQLFTFTFTVLSRGLTYLVSLHGCKYLVPKVKETVLTEIFSNGLFMQERIARGINYKSDFANSVFYNRNTCIIVKIKRETNIVAVSKNV